MLNDKGECIMKITEEKLAITKELIEKFGTLVDRPKVVAWSNGEKSPTLPRWLLNHKGFRSGRGQYDLSLILKLYDEQQQAVKSTPVVSATVETPEAKTE